MILTVLHQKAWTEKNWVTQGICLPMTICSLQHIFQYFVQSAFKMSQGMKKLVKVFCSQMELLVRKCFQLLSQTPLFIYFIIIISCHRFSRQSVVSGHRWLLCLCQNINLRLLMIKSLCTLKNVCSKDTWMSKSESRSCCKPFSAFGPEGR